MTNARDSYGPILESLLPLYPNLMRTGYARLAPTDRKVGHFAHGWFLRCQRSVEALLVLDAAGYWEEAAPIRRTIIENVLALKWLAAEGDSVNAAMAREHRYNVEKRLAAVTAAGWSSVNVADLQQIIAEVDATVSEDPNKYPLTFARRVKVYGDEHTIPGYLAECSKSHPTYQAAATYFNVTPTGPHLLGRASG